MKKYLIILIAIVLLSGCGEKKHDFSNLEITALKYNDILIKEEEYEDIQKLLSELPFQKLKKKKEITANLKITTTDHIHLFEVKDDSVVYQIGDTMYQSKKKNKIKELTSHFEELEKLYQDATFYQIKATETYEEKEGSILVKLDPTDHYIKMESELDLTHFKIHAIEKKGEEYVDTDLLYELPELQKKNAIYIRKETKEEGPTIRITFNTPYGYNVSIIPTKLKGENTILFKSKMIAQNP